MDIGVKTGGSAGGTVSIGQAELIPSEKRDSGEAKKVSELLPNPAVRITEKGVAEMLLQSQYETAKNTIDNMVDSPEERREKEERRLEEEAWAEKKADAEARADRNAALRQEDPSAVSFI